MCRGIADEAEIKRAFRRLAQRHHPDVDTGDGAEERFKELNEAYRVLSDRQRRPAYDMFGHAGVDGAAAAASRASAVASARSATSSTRSSAGARPDAPPPRVVPGADLRYDLTIEFAGGRLRRHEGDQLPDARGLHALRGAGGEPGTEPETCPRLQRHRRAAPRGADDPRPDGEHRGLRALPRRGADHRHALHGVRRRWPIREERTLEVTIPAGIDDGQRIALEGQGEAGPRGGPNGDLYVAVKVREHPQLVRRGTELFHELPITFPQAALGATLTVPTVEGSEEVAVPAGVQSGHEIRLRGKGVPRLRGAGAATCTWSSTSSCRRSSRSASGSSSASSTR